MRVLGVIGMLAAAAIVLVAMVVVGRGLAGVTSENGNSQVQTGSQKAYDDMKNDKDAPLDDPKEEMRGVMKDL